MSWENAIIAITYKWRGSYQTCWEKEEYVNQAKAMNKALGFYADHLLTHEKPSHYEVAINAACYLQRQSFRPRCQRLLTPCVFENSSFSARQMDISLALALPCATKVCGIVLSI